MSSVVIENPIINSPFYEPDKHFRFSDEGITNEVVAARRVSSYFVPIARPKKRRGAKAKELFETEWTQDRIEENKLVNGYFGVTPVTARLLSYWTNPDRERKLFFCQIHRASTDNIACWFVDTDYNGESFFVRHAYFASVEEPYDKLKRMLRAEIDEAVWSSLYKTVSLPFPEPETGKIAVKVINHYGDEVLKVFEV